MSDNRWESHLGLYDNVSKCSKCRFYSRDVNLVKKHEDMCQGNFPPKAWCNSCRFDAQNLIDIKAHRDRGDCVNEIHALHAELGHMIYDVFYI